MSFARRPRHPAATLGVWPVRRSGPPARPAGEPRSRSAIRLVLAAPGRLPPRLRLAATLGLPALVILAVLAAGFAALASRQLSRDFSQQLTIAADNIGNNIQIGVDRNGQSRIVYPQLDRVAASDRAVVRIIGGDHLAVLATTLDAPSLGPLRVAPADLGAYRVVTRLGHANIGPVYVQYARPVAALDATIGRLELYSVVGVIAGALLAGAAGVLIARRAGL